MLPRLLAIFTVLAASLGTPAGAAPQEPTDVPPERLEARERFRADRFGMFIHWGVYSLLANDEWVMENRNIRVGEYEWLASTFDPVDFDAREWVAVAKAAGMRYITITARHHDGFSMFDTEANGYDIVDWARFGRDPMAELAEAAREEGIQLFFYYSQLDWRHPDYFPRGRTGHGTGRSDSGNWTTYLAFMDMQLEELLTNYGPIGGIWFDGMWDRPDADWRLQETYALIHRLQPRALIIPNHHEEVKPGEDVQTFEQDLPGTNTTGWNDKAVSSEVPLETALTMNGSWGYDITDRGWKSTRELIHYLVRAAGSDANLLLNVGPRPDGTLQPEAVRRLREMGEWLEDHGSSVYGTRGGPIPPREWGVTTRRGDTVFVHVLNWPDRVLSIPLTDREISSAQMLVGGEPVPFRQDAEGLTLTLPAGGSDAIDRVVVLRVEGDSR